VRYLQFNISSAQCVVNMHSCSIRPPTNWRNSFRTALLLYAHSFLIHSSFRAVRSCLASVSPFFITSSSFRSFSHAILHPHASELALLANPHSRRITSLLPRSSSSVSLHLSLIPLAHIIGSRHLASPCVPLWQARFLLWQCHLLPVRQVA
jgi:hypothetical protein